jgi:hypothetical protein
MSNNSANYMNVCWKTTLLNCLEQQPFRMLLPNAAQMQQNVSPDDMQVLKVQPQMQPHIPIQGEASLIPKPRTSFDLWTEWEVGYAKIGSEVKQMIVTVKIAAITYIYTLHVWMH